jgi:hypothetical protein
MIVESNIESRVRHTRIGMLLLDYLATIHAPDMERSQDRTWGSDQGIDNMVSSHARDMPMKMPQCRRLATRDAGLHFTRQLGSLRHTSNSAYGTHSISDPHATR